MELDHVHLAVTNLDSSIEFYRDRLGFALGFRDEHMAEFAEGLVLDHENIADP